ncbi:flagellar biosynthetic protein FliR [Clostridia bacterium]|nr:flagellar biosynthetic protein FliR [Clostridia bacterium]
MVNVGVSVQTLEYFLMVMTRIVCFIFIAPFFGMRDIPTRVKAGFALFVSMVVFGVIEPQNPLVYSGIFEYAGIILREGITGLLIGFVANICNSIVSLSGKIIDMEVGFAMAQIFDPVSNTQSGLTGNLYNFFILLLLIATDMHHFILKALVDSYTVIPVNGSVLRWDALLLSMIQFMGDMMVIGFRIVLPIFACIMILNCVLGVLAKVSPQMNMFAIGLELKILVGLSILFLTMALLPSIANFIFEEMKIMMVSVMRGMMP